MKITPIGQRCLLLLAVVCVVLSLQLWAQGGANDNPSAPGTSKSPAPSEAAADATAKPHDANFVIGNDDVLAVNVWKEPEISRSVPVRSDGKISLPLVGELQAAGQTPHQLEQAIAAKLQSYISEPEVTVIVQEIKSQKFNIMGMVTKPGSYPLTNAVTVLDAVALAGGFRDFAKKKAIYVLRPNPKGDPQRLPFNYNDVIKGKNTSQNIKLEAGDTIYVP